MLFDIDIQGKPLKTPQGHAFQVPTLALARAIEEEWKKDRSPHYKQKSLTSLAATALDLVEKEKEAYVRHFIQSILEDGILFWASTPESLVKLQKEKWRPLIEKVNQTLSLCLKPTTSFSVLSFSSSETLRVKDFLNSKTTYYLAGFAHVLTLTSSFCISFLVIEGYLSAEEGWDLAHLHEHEQRRIWGEDEEALLREKSLRHEFFETLRFLKLIIEKE